MAHSIDIRPAFLHRLLVFQPIKSLSIEGDQVTFCWANDRRSHDLSLSSVEQASEWLILRRVTIATPSGRYSLGGISPAHADAIEAASAAAHRRRLLRESIDRDWEKFRDAFTSWSALLGTDRYICDSELRAWLAASPIPQLPAPADFDLVEALPPERRSVIKSLLEIEAGARVLLTKRNDDFAQAETVRFSRLLDSVESYPLTAQQKEAVIHDEVNNLVVAGAGTGKTSTIVAKVCYIVEKGLATSDEILMLAFTRKAADEMHERITRQLPAPPTVKTFHSLGLEILAQSEGKKPALSKAAEDQAFRAGLLDRITQELMREPAFMAAFKSFNVSPSRGYRPAWDFKSMKEYRQYLIEAELRTLAGYKVRSYEECEISNWMTLNGIRHEYERPYEHETATADKRQYKPDFFLLDYGVYIEHFGVNRDGRPAPFISAFEYQREMEWKRQLHREKGTKLVETFSWERVENTLLSSLEAKLKSAGVAMEAVPPEQALASLNEMGVVKPFVSLVSTFLSLFKSGLYDVDALRAAAGGREDSRRCGQFLELFSGIRAQYEKHLQESGEIDFEDMISRAVGHVEGGRFKSPYRYIIVDEFQDIAQGRAGLITALRGKAESGCKLFCVGDDWQSIYRFTGSDIAAMTQFERRFGFTKVTALETTHRFDSQLAAFSSKFVLKNPVQLKKILSARSQASEAAVVLQVRNKEFDPLPGILKEISDKDAASVFVLNRYNFQFSPEYARECRECLPKLKVEFLTAHSAKGLEADYVVVDNLRGGKYGFPSEVSDDPILGLVLAEPDGFPHGEERRLFYVALTRAKKMVYLVGDLSVESPFVRELLQKDSGYNLVIRGDAKAITPVCPECEVGRLTRRDGPFGVFYGCSQFPICDYKEDACPVCRKGLLRRGESGQVSCDACAHEGRLCPGCGKGVLVPKKNRSNGNKFLGCSRWRPEGDSCSYTESLGHSQRYGR